MTIDQLSEQIAELRDRIKILEARTVVLIKPDYWKWPKEKDEQATTDSNDGTPEKREVNDSSQPLVEAGRTYSETRRYPLGPDGRTLRTRGRAYRESDRSVHGEKPLLSWSSDRDR